MRSRSSSAILLSGLIVVSLGLWMPRAATAQPAIRTLEACDAHAEGHPDDPHASHCYVQLARSGRFPYETVQRHLEQVLERRGGHVQIVLAMGSLKSTRGDREALTLYDRAATEYAQQQNAMGEVLARTAHAAFLSIAGRFSEAVGLLERAEKAAAGSEDPLLMARVRTQQAWLAYNRRDYGDALGLLESVRAVVEGRGDPDLVSTWLSARGAAFWAIGRWDHARAAYREQASRLLAEGNRYEEANARVNLVLLAGGAERRKLALEAARIAREGGNRRAGSSAYFYLSEASAGTEGRAYAKRSLDLALAAGYDTNISRSRRALAFHTLAVDSSTAFILIDQAIEDARRTEDVNEELRSRFVKANMRWQVGPRPAATADSLALLDAIEAVRTEQPEEEIRAQRFSQWRWAYHRLAGHLLHGTHASGAVTSDDKALAFATLERMRGRLLLDRLNAAGAAVVPVNATGPRQVRVVPGDATPAHIQQALASDEALIAFQIASVTDQYGRPIGAWVWTFTRDRVSVEPLRSGTNLYGAVGLFLGLFDRRDGAEAVPAARLYQDLLAPAVAPLAPSIRKLIVIPDEMLYRVPFDALRERADAEPLAATYQISVVPSAALWLHWRQQPRPPRARPALIVADPQVPGYASVEGASSYREGPGAGLAPLPGARREGRILARALGRGSRTFVGAAASETAFKQETLADYAVLHLAAHAVIDDRHPERTGVLFAASEGAEDQGVLQVREIVDLPLSGQLVMLTACRSADGLTVPGEGALGLAHAFFRAGAAAVVASLWPIRDDDAAEAVELIATALGRGLSVGAAVTSARRELLARGAPAAAWAGLIVMGDGELVPLPGGRRWSPAWWMVGSLGCALFGAGGWIVRAGRERSRRSFRVPMLNG